MATDSFKFWDSYYSALRMLGTDERRGRFVMALCAYVFDGVEPSFSDDVMAFGFELVATQAKQSMELARAAREGGKRGGIKSGEARKRRGASSGGSTPLRSERKGEELSGSKNSSPSSNQPAPAIPTPPTRPAPADAAPPLRHRLPPIDPTREPPPD